MRAWHIRTTCGVLSRAGLNRQCLVVRSHAAAAAPPPSDGDEKKASSSGSEDTAQAQSGPPLGLILGGGAALAASAAGFYAYNEYAKKEKAAQELEAQQKAEREAQAEKERLELAALEAVRQEEERKERELKEQAEREAEAALQARREKVQAALQVALAEARVPSTPSSVVATLRSVIEAAEGETLPDTDLMKSAQARLAELDKISGVRKEREASREELKAGMEQRDLGACTKAIDAIKSSEECLTSLAEDFGPDDGLLAEGAQVVQELLAHEALDKAIRSRSPAACKAALAQAGEAGIKVCPATELATIITEPKRLYDDLVHAGADRLAELRRLPGFSVDDFSAAAAATTQGMDTEQLRQQAVDLAGTMIRNYEVQKKELKGLRVSAETALVDRFCNRTAETFQRYTNDKDCLEDTYRANMREEARQNEEIATAETQAAVSAAEEGQQQALLAEAKLLAETYVSQARQDVAGRLQALLAPVTAMEELGQSGQTFRQRSEASSSLSKALLALQGTLSEGRAAATAFDELTASLGGGEGGAFAQELRKRLPTETVARSANPVPTEPQLQHSFNRQLHDFTAAALTPPLQGGLLAGAMSHVLGHFLASFYVLDRSAAPQRASEQDGLGTSTEAARKNLESLSKAAGLVEQGEIRPALAAMESHLTGTCRARAEAWMVEARHALLLRQTVRALQAKADCLRAAVDSL